jgi:hypothetical protein
MPIYLRMEYAPFSIRVILNIHRDRAFNTEMKSLPEDGSLPILKPEGSVDVHDTGNPFLFDFDR